MKTTFRVVLALFSGLFVPTVFCSYPTLEEVAQAIDDAESVGWDFGNLPLLGISVVELPDAQGGTALRILVRPGRTLHISHLKAGPAVGHFSMRVIGDLDVDALSISGFLWRESHSGDWTAWNEIPFRQGDRSGERFFSYYHPYSATEPAEFFFDGYERFEGWSILGVSDELEIKRYPEGEAFHEDQEVILEAVLSEGDREFLFWMPWNETNPEYYRHLTSRMITLEGGQHRTYEVVVGQRISIPEGAWLVPDYMHGPPFLGEVQPGVWQVGEARSEFFSIVEVEGPGVLRFEVKPIDGTIPESIPGWEDYVSPDHPAILGEILSENYESRSLWFPPGEHRFYLSQVGALLFRKMEFLPDYFPLDVGIVGEGSVSGIESEKPFLALGAYQLNAEPSEGWLFDRWSGDLGSRDPNIEFYLSEQSELTAHFYRSIEWDGFDLRSLESSDLWKVGSEGRRPALFDESTLEGPPSHTLEWVFEGPGLFEVETLLTQGELWLQIDDGPEKEIDHRWTEEITHSLTFGAGEHRLRWRVRREYESGQYVSDLRFVAPTWTSGFSIKVETSEGGFIEGLGSGSFEPGQEVVLKATPAQGWRFVGWGGDIEETTSELRFLADRHYELIPNFEIEQEAPENALRIERMVGNAAWTYVDGSWGAPSDLKPGQSSRVLRTIQGPARFRPGWDRIEDEDGLWTYGVVGGESARSTFNSYDFIEVPEGPHTIYVEAAPTYYGTWLYKPRTLDDLVVEYRVELSVPSGHVEANVPLSTDLDAIQEEDPFLYWGYVREGSDFSLDVSLSGNEFSGWSGDYSGASPSGSVAIDRPFHARAHVFRDEIEWGDLSWSVFPEGSAYVEDVDSLPGIWLTGVSGEVVSIRSEIEGPSVLRFREQDAQDFSVRLDGDLIEDYSGIGYFWIVIDEGLHELEVSLTPRFPSTTSSQDFLQQGFYFLDYASGIPVPGYYGEQGVVQVTPSKLAYTPGEIVTFEATPIEGVEFVGWKGEFSGETNPFETTAYGGIQAEPIFEPSTVAGGYEWSYSGGFPYVTRYSSNQYLSYLFSEADLNGPVRRAETTVIGPGLLESSLSFWNFPEREKVTLWLDGERVEIDDSNISIPLSAGAHAFVWEIQPPSEIGEAGARVELKHPVVDSTVFFWVNSVDADWTVFPVQDAYQFGDLVTVHAPEQDDFGRSFVGWSFQGRGIPEYFASTDPDFSVVLEGPVKLTPHFGDRLPEVEGVYAVDGWRYEDGSDWMVVTDQMGPEGGTVLRGKPSDRLFLLVEEDSVVQFKVRAEVSLAKLEIQTQRSYTEICNIDWKYFSFRLKAGESIILAAQEYSSIHSRNVLIGDVSIIPGWAPNMIGGDVREFEFRELNGGPSDEALYEISPSSDISAEFLGWWNRDGEIDGDNPLVVEAESSEFYFPAFVERWEDLNASSETPGEWRLISGPEDENSLGTWSEVDGYTTFEEPVLRFTLTGPSVLRFKLDYRESYDAVRVLLNGNTAELLEDPEVFEGNALRIPEGDHTISFVRVPVKPSSIAGVSIVDLRLEGGLWTQSRETAGGFVTTDPDLSVAPIGEMISVEARPQGGFQFDDWSPPFQGFPSRFDWVVEGSVFPEARFVSVLDPIDPSETKLSFAGQTWDLRNVEIVRSETRWEEGNRVKAWTILAPLSDNPFLEAAIEAPLVVVQDSWASRLRVMDGANRELPLLRSNPRTGGNSYLGIPKAAIVMQLILEGMDEAWLSTENLSIRNAALVVARGAGVELEVFPDLPWYPVGSYVTVKVVDSVDPGLIEWCGLPEGFVQSGNEISFVVEDQVSIEARYWRPGRIFGLPVQYAGKSLWRRSGEWGNSDSYKWSPAVVDQWELNRLRFVVDQPGTLHFSLGAIAATDSMLLRNGEEVTFGTPAFRSGYLRMEQAGDSFEFFNGGYLSSNSSSPNAQIYDLRFFPDAPTPYLGWWLEHAPVDAIAESLLEPTEDLDGDGLLNYEEFLLGTNPWRGSQPLSIWRLDSERMELRHPPLDEGWIVRYRLDLDEPYWDFANDVLGEATADPLDVRYVRSPILMPFENGAHWFFVLDYSGPIPSLEELTE